MTDRTLPDAAPAGAQPETAPYSRRRFLTTAALLAGSGVLASLASCNKDDDPLQQDTGRNLGSSDVGLLNYLYVLKQLNTAFYKQVTETPYSGITAAERSLINDMAAHEKVQGEFLKQLISSAGSVPVQQPGTRFSSITFSNRTNVLTVARTLEDLNTAAFNGAGKLFVKPDYLLALAKMASVTARHAAIIHNLLAPGSFADLASLVNLGADPAQALDAAMPPVQVLDNVGKYLDARYNASNLPTS